MERKTIIDRYMSGFRKTVGGVVVILLVVSFIAGGITCYEIARQHCSWTGMAYQAACIAGGIIGGALICLVVDLIFSLIIPSVIVIFDMKDQIARIADSLDHTSSNQTIERENSPLKGTWVSHAIAPEKVAEESEPQKDYWVCRYCNHMNEWYWGKCHACGKRK